MAGVITRRQTKAVLALLQPDGAKCCPSVCPGPDAPANVRAADADMRIKRELYRREWDLLMDHACAQPAV
jgi:hypothetical protein